MGTTESDMTDMVTSECEVTLSIGIAKRKRLFGYAT